MSILPERLDDVCRRVRLAVVVMLSKNRSLYECTKALDLHVSKM